MNHKYRLIALFLALAGCAGTMVRADGVIAELEQLPAMTEATAAPAKGDWLVVPVERATGVYRSGPNEIAMTNGLVRRAWRVAPNGATVGFDNLMTGQAMLRGVEPEARIRLDGKDYDVGGLKGQPNRAYLRPDWIDAMTADPGAFRLTGIEVGPTKERFAWKRVRYSADLPWPPPGKSLHLAVRAAAGGPRRRHADRPLRDV